MKKTVLLLIALFLVSSFSFSQTISTGKVPKSVKKTFAKDYSKAVKPLWSISDGNYKVDFLNNGVKNAVTYDKSGTWQKKEVAVSGPKVPKEIKATLTKEFAGFRTTESIHITTPDSVSQYHLSVVKGKEAYNVYFSPAGEILKKEPKPENKPVETKKKK
jgi:hypothetical protein